MTYKPKGSRANQSRNAHVKVDADGLIRDIDTLIRFRDKGIPLSFYQIDILKEAGLWNQETYNPYYKLNY